jgi:hypothetical protein
MMVILLGEMIRRHAAAEVGMILLDMNARFVC